MNMRALGHLMKGSNVVGYSEAIWSQKAPKFRCWSLARLEGSLRVVYNYDNISGPNSAVEYYDEQLTNWKDPICSEKL
jgi:hypothetical protein